MLRLALLSLLIAPTVAMAQPKAAAKATAKAPPAVAVLPKVGDQLPVSGGSDWPKQTWLYAAPSQSDAAGKVVVFWFCSPRVASCTDDLARVIALRDAGKTYIVGFINGSSADAKKLDPIRESEGVGRGTVAFGAGATKLMKDMKIAPGPASVVVDVDGKVKVVTTSGDINELDARDKMVASLTSAIKDYTTAQDGPKAALKAGEKFALTFKVSLSAWLAFSKKTPMEFTLMAPKELACDNRTLKGDQFKIEGQTLTATLNCSAPHGSYEARGDIRFGYESPSGETGLGTEGATWKFEVK